MLTIPAALQTQFEVGLRNKAIPKQTHGLYKKWLRYYLDFCHKYDFPHEHGDSLIPFLNKLQGKNQTKAQRQQASQAIALYYELICAKEAHNEVPSSIKDCPPMKAPGVPSYRTVSVAKGATSANSAQPMAKSPHVASHPDVSQLHASRPLTGASWKAVYTRLANEIQLRHYSPKTLKSYTRWARQFQNFTRSKAPTLLSASDVKAFLSFLAVTRKVSAATQNQAFNALLGHSDVRTTMIYTRTVKSTTLKEAKSPLDL